MVPAPRRRGRVTGLLVILAFVAVTAVAGGPGAPGVSASTFTEQTVLDDPDPVTRPIIGGSQVTDADEFPWATYILARESDGWYECTGSLITPTWVLTAAHCVDSALEVRTLHGRLDEASSLSDPDLVTAARWFAHPDYDPGTTTNPRFGVHDVGLIELPSPRPEATMPLSGWEDAGLLAAGQMTTVIGWGLLEPSVEGTWLNRVDVPLRSVSECRSLYGDFDRDSNLCAGYAAGEAPDPAGSCQGDSGGPMMVATGGSQAWTQIGIVSWGIGECTDLDDYGGYMLVPTYLPWIEGHVGDLPGDGGRPPWAICPPDDAFEPNDSPAAATPVQAGQAYDGIVCRSDDDWFALQAVTGQYLGVTLEFEHDSGDLDLMLYDPEGNQVGSGQSMNDDERIEHVASRTGRYTIKVYGFGGAENRYRLRVSETIPAEVPMSPVRMVDTRDGSGAAVEAVGRLTPGRPMAVRIAGVGGVPAGVAAVNLNVVATEGAQAGYLAAYPCASGYRGTSNVNFAAATPTSRSSAAVMVPAEVDAAGEVCFVSNRAVHVVADVSGWMPAGGGYAPVTPTRLFDSRDGSGSIGGSPGRLGEGIELSVRVTGGDGVPQTGVAAVALNVVATGATRPGFMAVYPCAGGYAGTSNLNYLTGASRANAVITPVDAGGRFCVRANQSVDVVLDLVGWFAVGSGFEAYGPVRLFDTRDGTGGVGPWPVDEFELAFSPSMAVPALPDDATAVSLSVVATSGERPGYLSVYPCADGDGGTSTLNFPAGHSIANAAMVPLDWLGDVCFRANQPVHVVADLTGWIGGS